ncbi:hypothetical protein [Actinomadura sp. DC4]|uniref:hypothetical protein n=1 Tax=Actinomadura sp. DC4 TaxID=3055069 RepID=UPI0025AF64E5|nr:hypothetical protein [Actinomadura sp. DC4]MDN3353020.1 hypothetical protein [Actinomadura sp. DC4]
MTDYQYYMDSRRDRTIERPGPLWRSSGDNWEYLSLLDWEWHPLAPKRVPQSPPVEVLEPISEQQADELSRDRQRFVSYWARYSESAWESGGKPFTVLRRRSSPELVLDEAFGRENTWIKTSSVVEFEHPAFNNTLYLKDVDAETAERILRDIRGVSGATEL